jgi:cellobiose-specific phosphotransferase system component IIB
MYYFSFELSSKYHADADNPIAHIFTEMLVDYYIKNEGSLNLIELQTGLGKSYNAAAHIETELIKIANLYAKNINAALEKLYKLEKIASTILNKQLQIFDYTFKKNECYSTYMRRIANHAKLINKEIQESKHNTNDKRNIKKLVDEVIELSKKEITINPSVVATDKIHNVESIYQQVKKFINTDTRLKDESHRNFINSLIIRLKSNTDHLNNCNAKDIKRLLDVIKLVSKNLDESYDEYCDEKDFYESCKKAKKFSSKHKAKAKEKLEKVSCHFYSELLKGIAIYKKDIDDKNKDIADDVIDSIIRIFPATKIMNSDVACCFITTKKFIKPLAAFPKRFHIHIEFPSFRLYLDESDKQNAVIRDELFKGNKIFLIKTLKALAQIETHNKLQKRDFSIVHPKIATSINAIREIWNKYNLDNSIDVINAADFGEIITLFHAYGMISAIYFNDAKNNKEDKFHATIQHNEEDAINEIEIIKKSADSLINKNQHTTDFTDIFNEINNACQQFIHDLCVAVILLVSNQRKKLEQQNKPITNINIYKYLNTIISSYGLGDIKEYLDNYIYAFSSASLRYNENKELTNKIGFHNSGFYHNCVTREGASEHTVEFVASQVPISASGFLANLVLNGAKVILMSATATAKTVLHNFDLKYLKQILGKDQYKELTTKQKNEIANYYKQKRNFYKYRIQLIPNFLLANHYVLKEYIKKHPSFGNVDLLFKKIYPANKEPKDKTDTDERQRYLTDKKDQISKLIQAIKIFIESKHNKYMLCLLSRLIGKTNDLELKLIENIVSDYAEQQDIKVLVKSNLNAEKLRDGEFSSALEQLATAETDKLIIISSYPTMGEGLNPQYNVKDTKDICSLIYTDDTISPPKNISVDIDTIYLDRPTNMFPVAGDYTKNNIDYETKVSCEYNILSLLVANIIPPKVAKNFIYFVLGSQNRNNLTRDLQAAYMSNSSGKLSFNNSTDYIWAVIRIIEQALGRMGRTAYKRAKILILADSSLQLILATDNRDPKTLSHEYIALRELSKSFTAQIKQLYKIPDEVENLNNTAILSNKLAHGIIKKMVNNILAKDRLDINNRLKNMQSMAKKINELKTKLTYNELKTIIHGYKRQSIEHSLKVNENINSIKGYKGGFYSSIDALIKDYQQHNKQPQPTAEAIISKTLAILEKYLTENDKMVNKWITLRNDLLKNPTISYEQYITTNKQYIYIEIPDGQYEQGLYCYSGIPKKKYLDYYQFFSLVVSKKLEVSAEQAGLNHVLSNPITKQYFEKNGFALNWQVNKIMMSPIIFTNIYRPAIAEQAVKAILENQGIKVHNMPKKLTEYTDFIIEYNGKKALLDVKYWQRDRYPKETYTSKLIELKKHTGIKRTAYINFVNSNQEKNCNRMSLDFKIPAKNEEALILSVDGILNANNSQLIKNNVTIIKQFIVEE